MLRRICLFAYLLIAAPSSTRCFSLVPSTTFPSPSNYAEIQPRGPSVHPSAESRFGSPLLRGGSPLWRRRPVWPSRCSLGGEAAEQDSGPTQQKRHFVVVCHNVSEAVSLGKFRPNNLLEGRVDVMCRCITNSLWVSNGVRKNTHIWFVLQPLDVVVGVSGGEIFGLNPDEKTTALFLQRALEVDAFKMELERERQEGAKAASEPPKTESEVHSFNKGDRKGGFNKSDRNLAKKQSQRRRMATAHWEFGENGDPLTPPGFSVERGIDLQVLLSRLDGQTWWLHEEGDHVLGECSGVEGGSMVVVVGDQIGFTPEEERLLDQWQGMKKVRLGSTSLLASQCLLLTHHYLDGDGIIQ